MSLQELVQTPSSDIERYLKDCARTTGPLPSRLALPDGPSGPRLVRCDGGLLGVDDTQLVLLRLREVGQAEPFLLLGQQIQELTREVLLRKEAEAKQRRLYEATAQAQVTAEEALQLREEFLSIASHELRNPLNAVKIQLSGLARTASRRPEEVTAEWALARAGKALAQIERMERLMKELLDVTRLTAGRLTLELDDVDLYALVDGVIEQQRQVAVGQEISLTAARGIVGRWDTMRLEQVVTNLVSNAVKYGNGGPVSVVLSRDTDHVLLEVTDSGIGIAAEDCARIFDRFERAVSLKNHGGFGLGLWISRQIVEAHGGSIGVRSVLGSGSTFVVRLPLALSPGGQ